MSTALWPPTPLGVRRARHHLGETLKEWGLTELVDPAKLVLSELMTNAMQHGRVPGRQTGTRFIREGDSVRIEVHDAHDKKPQMKMALSYEESGRGLALVDTLTGQQWGVAVRDGPGKLIWAQISKP
jgi:anti-sigma regulatory factor (Ser/Thr protein kinase)